MARTKKSHWAWRATKAVARGVGKGSWWVVKNTAKGVYKGGAAVGSTVVRKIKEKKKESALKKQPHYAMPATFEEFEVVKAVSGDFSAAERRLLHDSLIVLIFGKRGSGKSALGFRLMENIHEKTGRKGYVLGVGQEVLPQWITSVESLEQVGNGGIVLVDEGALTFASRESMSGKNVALGKLLAVARHKDLTLLFITQNTGMIDKNVLSLADTLMVKQGSLLQQEMERPEIKKFYEKAESAFAGLEGDKKKYVYIIDSDFEGVVSLGLPSFWSSKVSKSRA